MTQKTLPLKTVATTLLLILCLFASSCENNPPEDDKSTLLHGDWVTSPEYNALLTDALITSSLEDMDVPNSPEIIEILRDRMGEVSMSYRFNPDHTANSGFRFGLMETSGLLGSNDYIDMYNKDLLGAEQATSTWRMNAAQDSIYIILTIDGETQAEIMAIQSLTQDRLIVKGTDVDMLEMLGFTGDVLDVFAMDMVLVRPASPVSFVVPEFDDNMLPLQSAIQELKAMQ